jgi:PilZ domain
MANGKSIRHSPFARLKPCTASGELGHCVQERRKVPRDRTFLNGQIAFNNKNSIADCFVRNCSSEGAKIAVAETLPLPREFDFLIPGKREIRHARLVWRRGAQAGVTFVA